ncbi:hypothetical protein [Halarcobacter anaerophilus]|uniref:DNA-binding protein n=1 Tax=Halarcobacter anaerophilus TaxID=877500 RepID=A0A4Q0Y334_9BACT|nr:hypothetical protein [Halarcobacter anaerophilus]QDF29009.1 hypothetical protein AANAER_1529 [Halarcobacter anaerophilus]RXJ63644.1 hypothetical protein CRV06_05470 [Halarcobacter anaerophilus]
MMDKDRELLLTILSEVREIKEDNKFLKSLVPEELSLSELSNMTGKTANTLRKYIIANFEPEEDYEKKSGKIYVKQDVVLRIRRHYAR